MAHIVQVGAGSGGMVVLDLVCRDPRVTALTLIEPDVYKPHNVERHYFGPKEIGRLKAALAESWLREHRPDLTVRTMDCDVTAPEFQAEIENAISTADLGVCAVDNEAAKYHWDGLMRKYRTPWTLGEVLSGGIGGFVHRFVPEGPCYGCVASFLQRSVEVEKPPVPDYSHPGGVVEEVTIPASKASIHAIASLHALVTLSMLVFNQKSKIKNQKSNDFTSLLISLQRLPDIFDEHFRVHRFQIERSENCLICQSGSATESPAGLDAALDQALARLSDA